MRQAAVVIDHAQLMRLTVRPFPENDVYIPFRSADRKTRHDYAGTAGRDESLRKAPGRRRISTRGDSLPRTAKLKATGAAFIARRTVRQVENVGAIGLIGTERQGLRLERESLLRL